MAKMLAAVWRGQGRENFNVEEMDIPSVSPDEVLIKVDSVFFGAMHVRMVLRGHPELKAPCVEGRMVAGDIVEVGANVRNLKPGMRVTVNPEAPCGKCFYCLKGEPVHCLNLKKLSPGGMSQYVHISKELVPGIVEFPASISYAHAAWTESLACAMLGNLKGKVTFGDRVAIIGCGQIGLAHLQLAKLRGATHVIMLDVVEEALAPLRKEANVYTINPTKEDAVQAMKALTDGYGADVVIEAVGRAESYKMALDLARRGGTVVGFGGCPPNTSFPCDPNIIHYRSINFDGSYHYYPELFKQALNLVVAGRIDLNPIVNTYLPMSRLSEAVDLYQTPACKALVLQPWK
jgi:L-iditol 2-dehydrogenase